jgi:hypothetical protein
LGHVSQSTFFALFRVFPVFSGGIEDDLQMKVHLMEAAVREFIGEQLSTPTEGWYFPHSIVDHFHTCWYADVQGSLSDKYDRALRSEISQRWWKRDAYRPKEIMLQLISTDPELAAIAWKDLQQDHAQLEGRLSRFNYYCDQLLLMYRGAHPRAIETYHHQDAGMMSLYLAGLFPEKYTLYPGLDIFQSFCRVTGSPEIPKVDDLVRYMKIASICMSFLRQHNQFPTLLQQRSGEVHRIKCIPMVIVYEFILHATGHMSAVSG